MAPFMLVPSSLNRKVMDAAALKRRPMDPYVPAELLVRPTTASLDAV
jgi:hypothetical protein